MPVQRPALEERTPRLIAANAVAGEVHPARHLRIRTRQRIQQVVVRPRRERARELASAALATRRQLNYVSGYAEALLVVARLTDDRDEAERLLDESVEQAARNKQPGTIWLAHSERARRKLPPRPNDDEVGPDDATVLEQREGSMAFYQGTGEQQWLDEARLLLSNLRAHAPREFRDSMVENVPTYRAILDA